MWTKEVFWFPFVVWVVLANHIWADVGCMQGNNPCAEQKRWNTFAKSYRLKVISFFLFSFFRTFICTYLVIEISRNIEFLSFESQVANRTLNNEWCKEEKALVQISSVCYSNICWLHRKPQNTGHCPQRLNCQQIANGLWAGPLHNIHIAKV